MAELETEVIDKELERMRDRSVQELVEVVHEKYREPESIDEPLEAVLQLLNKHFEMYLTDDQYTELKTLKERNWGALSDGARGALHSLGLLQAVHKLGVEKYFGRKRRLREFLGAFLVATLIWFVVWSVIGTAVFSFASGRLLVLILPFAWWGSGPPGVLGAAILAVNLVIPVLVAYFSMDNRKRLTASYLRNRDRLAARPVAEETNTGASHDRTRYQPLDAAGNPVILSVTPSESED